MSEQQKEKKAGKSRPAWLTGGVPGGGRTEAAEQTPREKAGRRGPLAEETSRATETGMGTTVGAGGGGGELPRQYLGGLGYEGHKTPAGDGGNAGAGSGAVSPKLDGIGELIREKWRFVALGLLGVLIAIYGLLTIFGGGEQAAQAPESGGPSPARQEAQGEAIDSGIAFSELDKSGDGEATLEAGDLSWEGEAVAGEEGETITLQGPTAAQFERGFQLAHSEVESGTYAVAQEEGPVIHVETHTFRVGETELTQGSIFAIEDDALVDDGFYLDERESGSGRVVRTYFDPQGDYPPYQVAFEAPERTPVPLLVGWRGPGGGEGAQEESEGPAGGESR